MKITEQYFKNAKEISLLRVPLLQEILLLKKNGIKIKA